MGSGFRTVDQACHVWPKGGGNVEIESGYVSPLEPTLRMRNWAPVGRCTVAPASRTALTSTALTSSDGISSTFACVESRSFRPILGSSVETLGTTKEDPGA
jgi:hypothetical protein